MPLSIPADGDANGMLSTLRTTLERWARRSEARIGLAETRNKGQQTQLEGLINPVRQLGASAIASGVQSYCNGTPADAGFYTLPSGLIVQWGSYVSGGSQTGNGDEIPFPTAYLHAVLSIQVTESHAGTNWPLGAPAIHAASFSSTPLTSWLHYCDTWDAGTWTPAGNSYSWISLGF